MTKRNKLLVTILCLACVLCALVSGTIAWLISQPGSITNTFTSSDVTITLTETKGTLTDGVRGFKMVPGEVIAKDPVVAVEAGSEACYVFVKIDENLGSWSTYAVAGKNFKSFLNYTVDTAEGWTALEGYAGVYYIKVDANIANEGKSYNVLAGNVVTVSGENVTKAMMETLEASDANLPTLTFTASAIQVANLPDKNGDTTVDAVDAWLILNGNN